MRYRPVHQVPTQQVPSGRPRLHRLTPMQLDKHFGPSVLVRDPARNKRPQMVPGAAAEFQRG